MKPTLTITFDSMAGLYEAVDRLRGQQDIQVIIPPIVPAAPAAVAAAAAAAEKVRKPRSDAGKPRGQYNKTTEAPQSPASASAPASAAPAQASTPAAETAAPAAAEATGAPLTEADVRAALKVVSGTDGLGVPACMGILNSFGVERISMLPKEEYANFKAACERIVDNHTAAKK